MKTILLLLTLATATGLHAAPVMRDAATHENITLLYRKAMNDDPMQKQARVKGPDPSLVSPPPGLLENSDVLCFNGMATLVPKLAILQIPQTMRDRLTYRPGAKLMSWGNFYAQNRGWITTVEVNRAQSEGREPIPEQTQTQLSKTRNLIIGTYLAGPISVLPLKAVEEATVKTTQL